METEISEGTHRAYTQYIAPGWMRTEWSDKFRQVIASLIDMLAELTLECIRAGSGRRGPAVELSDLVRMGSDVSLPRVANEPVDLYRQRLSQAWEYWANAGSDAGASLLFQTLGPADMLARFVTPNLNGLFAIETYTSTDWPDLAWGSLTDAIRVVVVAPPQAGIGSARVTCNGGFVDIHANNYMPGLAWLIPYNLPPHCQLINFTGDYFEQSLGYADSRTRMWAQHTNVGMRWDSEDGLPWDDGTGESLIINFGAIYTTDFPDTIYYFPFLHLSSGV